MKPSSGLEPSVYGGGGSPSSRFLLESPLSSWGSAALTSASAVEGRFEGFSKGGAGAKAGSVYGSGSVTIALACAAAAELGELGGKYKDENGGGRGDGGFEDEANAGREYRGSELGSAVWVSVDTWEYIFSDTDEPSLDSRVTDNLESLLAAGPQ